MTRTLVIGDIHGGLRALIQVLGRAAITLNDELIFLGDYVDGWSESAQVIEYLMTLDNKQHCIFLKGNHDAWCEEWLATGIADSGWLSQGGQATVESYAALDAVARSKHLQFFRRLKYYEIDSLNRLFVHAGFTSIHGPKKESESFNLIWDRTLWQTALDMDIRVKADPLLLPARLRLFKEIFIGHTPTLYYNEDTPMNACNVWNIDTGAAFSGKLTAMDADTKQFWQSDPVRTLYPGEAGRNRG